MFNQVRMATKLVNFSSMNTVFCILALKFNSYEFKCNEYSATERGFGVSTMFNNFSPGHYPKVYFTNYNLKYAKKMKREGINSRIEHCNGPGLNKFCVVLHIYP